MDSLLRTFHPKYSFYKGDGTGRDEYISVNSGGFYHGNSKPDIFRRTSGNVSAQTQYFAPAPRLNSPILRYYSDGSGRDHYITHNSGGLHVSNGDARKQDAFIDSLRSNPQLRRNKSDLFARTTSAWINPKKRENERKKHEKVKSLVQRLYTSGSSKKFDGLIAKNSDISHLRHSSTLPIIKRT